MTVLPLPIPLAPNIPRAAHPPPSRLRALRAQRRDERHARNALVLKTTLTAKRTT
jgi:hypothetical protein